MDCSANVVSVLSVCNKKILKVFGFRFQVSSSKFQVSSFRSSSILVFPFPLALSPFPLAFHLLSLLPSKNDLIDIRCLNALISPANSHNSPVSQSV